MFFADPAPIAFDTVPIEVNTDSVLLASFSYRSIGRLS